MKPYFTQLLKTLDELNINILDAYIAHIINDRFPNLSEKEFENICSEYKDKYLKNEYFTLDD